MIPTGLHARLDRSTWAPPAVFRTVGEVGSIERGELERTLNMGVGMVAVLPAEQADAALRALGELGLRSWALGTVEAAADAQAPGSAALVGDYAD